MSDREIEKITANVTKDVPIPVVKPLEYSNIDSITFTVKDTNTNTNKKYSIVTGNTYKIDYSKDIKVDGKWSREEQKGIDSIAKVTYLRNDIFIFFLHLFSFKTPILYNQFFIKII